jgi:hypothetical protein
MREVTKQVYTFNELSLEAQDKAIQNHIDSIEWSMESESITENFKYQLMELGYPTEDVEWSLNSCQGDGVAFYGDIVNILVVAERLLEPADYLFLAEHLDEIRLEYTIVRNSFGYRYNHWNTMDVEMILESYSDDIDFDGLDYYDANEELSDKLKEIADNLNELISSDIKEVSRKLEKDGYEDIDYIQNEDNVREYLSTESDNEYYENGKVFVG